MAHTATRRRLPGQVDGLRLRRGDKTCHRRQNPVNRADAGVMAGGSAPASGPVDGADGKAPGPGREVGQDGAACRRDPHLAGAVSAACRHQPSGDAGIGIEPPGDVRLAMQPAKPVCLAGANRDPAGHGKRPARVAERRNGQRGGKRFGGIDPPVFSRVVMHGGDLDNGVLDLADGHHPPACHPLLRLWRVGAAQRHRGPGLGRWRGRMVGQAKRDIAAAKPRCSRHHLYRAAVILIAGDNRQWPRKMPPPAGIDVALKRQGASRRGRPRRQQQHGALLARAVGDEHDVARPHRIAGEMVEAGAVADGPPLASRRFHKPSGVPPRLGAPAASRQKHLMTAIAMRLQRVMVDRRLHSQLPAVILIMEGHHGVAEFGGAGRAVMDELAVHGIARRHQRHRIRRRVEGEAKPAARPEEHHMDGGAQLGEKHRRPRPLAKHKIEGEARPAIDRFVAMPGKPVEIGRLDAAWRKAKPPVAVGQDVIDHPGRIVGPGGGEAAVPQPAIAPPRRIIIRRHLDLPPAKVKAEPRRPPAKGVGVKAQRRRRHAVIAQPVPDKPGQRGNPHIIDKVAVRRVRCQPRDAEPAGGLARVEMQFEGKLERACLLVGDFGQMNLLPAAGDPQIEAKPDRRGGDFGRCPAHETARKADDDPHRIGVPA